MAASNEAPESEELQAGGGRKGTRGFPQKWLPFTLFCFPYVFLFLFFGGSLQLVLLFWGLFCFRFPRIRQKKEVFLPGS